MGQMGSPEIDDLDTNGVIEQVQLGRTLEAAQGIGRPGGGQDLCENPFLFTAGDGSFG